jgi:hypothetical protein
MLALTMFDYQGSLDAAGENVCEIVNFDYVAVPRR